MNHNTETIYIFAARYTHNRNTGGTDAVIRGLAQVWDKLTPETQEKIEKEAQAEATENRIEWAEFFGWESTKYTHEL